MKGIKLAIFASGSGSNAENIINHFNGNDQVKVELILSNKSDAKVLERAQKLGVKSIIFDRDTFYNSDNIVDLLQNNEIDYIILAGFLWLVPVNILEKYSGRIVNVHPALLPRHGGKGMYGDNVHRAVIESGDRETGITIHLVNEHYDSGDIISQHRVEVTYGDDAQSVAEKVHALEYKHFPEQIERWIAKKSEEKSKTEGVIK